MTHYKKSNEPKSTKCSDVLEFDIFTQEFTNGINQKISGQGYDFDDFDFPLSEIGFEEDWLAILNFYVFPLVCHSDKKYSHGKFMIKSINCEPQFLPELAEAETEMVAILPLTNVEQLQLTFQRYAEKLCKILFLSQQFQFF